MSGMKGDMSGAAAVLAAIRAIACLGECRVPVIGLLPLCENLLSGSAQKPGDVVKTRSGKFVEVGFHCSFGW